MSWNKHTIVVSEVDSVMRTLTELGEPFSIEVIGQVQGFGLNDDFMLDGEASYYAIRKLQYRDVVICEQMIRSVDCDADDTIVSYRYNIKDEPKEWKLEVYCDEENCEQE